MNKSDIKLIAVLERTGGFASAQELHQILRREGDGIGLTTVYRALQSLVDDKIVDLLRREDGEAIYRLCGDTHHHHLVLLEITASFSPDTYEIEMYLLDNARCAMCQAHLTAPTPIDHPAA